MVQAPDPTAGNPCIVNRRGWRRCFGLRRRRRLLRQRNGGRSRCRHPGSRFTRRVTPVPLNGWRRRRGPHGRRRLVLHRRRRDVLRGAAHKHQAGQAHEPREWNARQLHKEFVASGESKNLRPTNRPSPEGRPNHRKSERNGSPKVGSRWGPNGLEPSTTGPSRSGQNGSGPSRLAPNRTARDEPARSKLGSKGTEHTSAPLGWNRRPAPNRPGSNRSKDGTKAWNQPWRAPSMKDWPRRWDERSGPTRSGRTRTRFWGLPLKASSARLGPSVWPPRLRCRAPGSPKGSRPWCRAGPWQSCSPD